MNNTNKVKTILFASLIAAMILPFGGMTNAYADHDNPGDLHPWTADREFDIQSSLWNVSHASFTPDTDFEDAAAVWNAVGTSWWDFTRDDSSNDVLIGSWFMGWHITTLAETSWIDNGTNMLWAALDYNSAKDFRDVNVSQGWWSYDYETVAICGMSLNFAAFSASFFHSGSLLDLIILIATSPCISSVALNVTPNPPSPNISSN